MDLDERIKIKDFLIECSYIIVKFFLDTSMTEIKPVVMEKHEFEYRDENLLVALFGFFEFLRF